ncbi:MAG: aldehyde dehydrogenase family protein [Pseudomonadota bacterium]
MTFMMMINGVEVEGDESFDVINPATGSVFAKAPDCTKIELDSAILSARNAQSDWQKMPIADRKECILKFAGKIAEQGADLARLLTTEQGKPFEDAMGDVMGGAYWLSETCNYDLPVHEVEETDERRAITKYEPIGVVAGLVPWNFPIILACFKIAPALLAGNTMVLKPAPTTPLTTLRIGQIAKDVFPAGVFNVISGSDRLGPWLTSHPGIDKVSFTGSTQTGKRVMESAAPTLKRLTLELGGNDAAIVMPDVDVEQVAKNLFWAAFRNTGQICIATKRMYIHEDVYEPIKQAIVEYARTIKVGDGAEQGTQIGPVQNKKQYQVVLDLIEDAKKNGYEFLVGGETSSAPGYFIPITILDNPPETARIVQEEQFGPVLPLLKFDDLDAVIGKANATEFGLGASVWSDDLDRAEKIAEALEAGTVWINETQYLSPHGAFGGWKQSGIGVEGAQHGLMEFTRPKTIFTRFKPAPIS